MAIQQSIGTRVPKPNHVPDHLVVDLDVHFPGTPDEDPLLAWKRHIGPYPVVWTPHQGGHWVAVDSAIYDSIYRDTDTWSSRNIFVGPRNGRPQLLPSEYDPPEHANFRKHIMQLFHPKVVREWTEEARELTVGIIEELQPQGRCEFVEDFAKQLPMIITLRMLSLPQSDREKLVDLAFTALRPATPEEGIAAQMGVAQYLAERVQERIANPGDDGLSLLVATKLPDGSELNIEQKIAMSTNVLFGGLDTVATTMAWTALYMAENPALQHELRGNKALIARTTEELLRRFGISQVSRVATRDVELAGAPIKAGEQVCMPAAMSGLNADIFPDPDAIVPGRSNANKHHTMGGGVHRCAGALLAHAELRVFLEEWLDRIPQFSLDPNDRPVKLATLVPCVDHLPLVW